MITIKSQLGRLAAAVIMLVIITLLAVFYVLNRVSESDELASQGRDLLVEINRLNLHLSQSRVDSLSTVAWQRADESLKNIDDQLDLVDRHCSKDSTACALLSEVELLWASQREDVLLILRSADSGTDPALVEAAYGRVFQNAEKTHRQVTLFTHETASATREVLVMGLLFLLACFVVIIISILVVIRLANISFSLPLQSLGQLLQSVTEDKEHLEPGLKQFHSFGVEWLADSIGCRNREVFELVKIFDEMSAMMIELMDEKELKHVELCMALEQAEDAARVKSDFLANMSHEIRTPMNAIIGMTHLVLQTQLDDIQQNYLEKVHLSAQRLLNILSDILDYSRIESGKLALDTTYFKLDDLLHSLTANIHDSAAARQQQVALHMNPSVPKALVGDPRRLLKVFQALADNAIKFTPSGGTIEISISELSRNEKNSELLFEFRDNGIGMTEKQLATLFRPFTQGDTSSTRSYGGTGLGLVISKTLVDMMGGEITISSEYGKGSVFRIVLSFERQVIDRPEHYPHQEFDGDIEKVIALLYGKHLLIVEDNEANQRVLHDMLSGNGINVMLAGNAQTANEYLEKYPFDAMIIDCDLVDINACQIVDKVEKTRSLASLVVIGMTGQPNLDYPVNMHSSVINDFISKPVNVDDVLRTLAAWIITEETDDFDADFAGMQALPNLRDVDTRHGLKQVQGNHVQYVRLLKKFAHSSRDFIERFNKALLDPDDKAAVHVIHSLFSMSASLGLTRVRQTATLLEKACLDGRKDLERYTLDLETSLKAVWYELDKLSMTQTVAAEQQYDEGHIRNLIVQMKQEMQNDNIRARDLMVELQGILKGGPFNLWLEAVRQPLETYRFEEALTALAKLCKELEAHFDAPCGTVRQADESTGENVS